MMEGSSKMTSNPTESNNVEPDVKPGMQLATLQGSLLKGIIKRENCTESSSSQSKTKHEQSLSMSSNSSGNKRMKISSGKAVKVTHSPSKKAGSETRIPVLPFLPAEVWLKIFQHSVRAYGPLPFLLRAAGVCRFWRDLAHEPALWEKLDLRCGKIKQNPESLKWLADRKMSICKEIILDDWGYETDSAVELIARYCPQLQTIDLSRSRMLSESGVAGLLKKCRKLRSINVMCAQLLFTSFLLEHNILLAAADHVGSLFKAMFPGSEEAAKHLSKGFPRSSLECIRLSGNNMRPLNSNFRRILSSCPMLKILRLSVERPEGEDLYMDPEEVQASCPFLRVLDLDGVSLFLKESSQEAQDQTKGLVHLQELRCSRNDRCPLFHVDTKLDLLLSRLLFNSAQLKVLDLSGNCVFDASVLLSLPNEALEELNLSKTALTGPVLKEIFRKWGHSLTTLTLNNVRPSLGELQDAFEILTDLPTCPLRELSLSCTWILLSCVRILTGKLKHLEVLQLEGSGIPYEISRRYEGQQTIRRLHQRVFELLYIAPDSD